MNGTTIVVIVLVLLVALVLGIVLSRRRRSTALQEQFGPEYERRVASSGGRRAAEAELSERRQRREEFDVRDLGPEERSHFRDRWNDVQRGFVDDPRHSLQAADALVVDVMRTRGYPVNDDFDRRADDLSVDHPRVVQHYREARQVHDAGGEVDTERQRGAVRSYRSLVDALLGDEDTVDSPASGAGERTAATDGATGRGTDPEGADDGYGRHALRDGDHGTEHDTDRSADRDATRDADRGATRGTDAVGDAGREVSPGREVRDDRTARPPADPTADPNGPQGPRTEERTR